MLLTIRRETLRRGTSCPECAAPITVGMMLSTGKPLRTDCVEVDARPCRVGTIEAYELDVPDGENHYRHCQPRT